MLSCKLSRKVRSTGTVKLLYYVILPEPSLSGKGSHLIGPLSLSDMIVILTGVII